MKTHGSLQSLVPPAVISLPCPQLTWPKRWINWEFIISNLIISVTLSNTVNHWNLTNIPLGPTNSPHTAFLLALHQTLAPVGIFGVSISTNEERDAEEQILPIPETRREQTQPFPLFQLLYRARVPPKPANFTWSPCTSCVISHPRWGSVNVKVKQYWYKITGRYDLIFPLLWVR